MEEERIRQNIANNITAYRKQCNMTQAQLADRLAYSDKAVSKWERGDGTPDIFVLVKLCKLFGIEISDLLSDEVKQATPYLVKRRVLITVLSCLLNWLVAVVVFVILSTILKDVNKVESANRLWVIYIYAINSMFIILMVYASMWTKKIGRTIVVSGLIWSTCLTIFITLFMFAPSVKESAWMFFLIGIPLEIAFILFFGFKKYHH